MEKSHLLQPSQPQRRLAGTPTSSFAPGSRPSGEPAFADVEQESTPAVVALLAQRIAPTSPVDADRSVHPAEPVPNPVAPTAGSIRPPVQRRARPAPQMLSHTDIRYLQRTVGNRALAPLLQTDAPGRLPSPQSRAQQVLQRKVHLISSPAQREDISIETMQRAAQTGIQTPSSELPYAGRIQQAFGRHDVRHIRAHLGQAAAESAQQMNADAYATGNHIVFADLPDLHTTAHEAAHAIQQRNGAYPSDGIGQVGDVYEQHADAVADRVVAGQSVEGLLNGIKGEQHSVSISRKVTLFNSRSSKTEIRTVEQLKRYLRGTGKETYLKRLEKAIAATHTTDQNEGPQLTLPQESLSYPSNIDSFLKLFLSRDISVEVEMPGADAIAKKLHEKILEFKKEISGTKEPLKKEPDLPREQVATGQVTLTDSGDRKKVIKTVDDLKKRLSTKDYIQQIENAIAETYKRYQEQSSISTTARENLYHFSNIASFLKLFLSMNANYDVFEFEPNKIAKVLCDGILGFNHSISESGNFIRIINAKREETREPWEEELHAFKEQFAAERGRHEYLSEEELAQQVDREFRARTLLIKSDIGSINHLLGIVGRAEKPYDPRLSKQLMPSASLLVPGVPMEPFASGTISVMYSGKKSSIHEAKSYDLASSSFSQKQWHSLIKDKGSESLVNLAGEIEAAYHEGKHKKDKHNEVLSDLRPRNVIGLYIDYEDGYKDAKKRLYLLDRWAKALKVKGVILPTFLYNPSKGSIQRVPKEGSKEGFIRRQNMRI
jgi:Domain of unknown function (DUF4157)